MKLEVETN